MQEIIDQVLEYARGAWRFRRLALITAWATAIVGWAAIFLMPDIYEAHSRVFVDTKTALKPVLKDLVLEADVNGQLSLVRQSLLAMPQLEPVAQEVGLIDPRTMTPQERVHVIDEFRERIDLTVIQAGNPQDPQDRDAGSIYQLQYRDASRERSLKVIDILQNRLIENTLGGKRQGSENAQKFLLQQIADYETRLRVAEDRLAEFKKRNVGLMPNEQGGQGYFSRLQTEMDAVNQSQSVLALALSKREELQRQLRGEAPIAAAAGATGVAGQPGASNGDTLSRIKETQARLDELLLRFTEKHPDVIAARENLEQLKLRRANEIEALRRGDPNAAAASGASSNPVYQSIQLQLNQTEVEIASVRRQLADHQNRVSELRKLLDTMPQVEAEYARLNRDYDVTKANYTQLVERLEKSKLGEEATTSGSVRFDIIEPPTSPFKPTSPRRSLLIVGVLFVGVAAGLGVAILLHLLQPVFTSTRALADATGLQVLGSVSMTWLTRLQTERRRSYWRYSAAIVALFAVGIVVLQLSRMGVRLSSLGT